MTTKIDEKLDNYCYKGNIDVPTREDWQNCLGGFLFGMLFAAVIFCILFPCVKDWIFMP